MDFSLVQSLEKANENLGWAPVISLPDEGFQKFLDWSSYYLVSGNNFGGTPERRGTL